MPQILFLLAICYAAFLATGVFGQPPPPSPGPAVIPPQPEPNNCPSQCGGVHIPYPFGVGPGCFLAPEFELTCNETTSPPSLFTGNVRIANITLETAQMKVYSYLTYSCNVSMGSTWHMATQNMSLNVSSPFLVSPSENVFTGIGCHSVATLEGQTNTTYLTGCITTCTSVDDTGNDGTPCRGQGCCEASMTPNLMEFSVVWEENANAVPGNPCQYAFVATKGWYNFSREDLTGNMTFANKYDGVVPVVLDWAVRDGTCPQKPKGDAIQNAPYGACVSTNSYCVNASNDAEGYFCNCSKGYTGNPYKIDGCTNINECKLRESLDSYRNMYPCRGGTCKDVEGDYECKCNFGQRGDGKSDKGCEPVLPKPAVAVIVCAPYICSRAGTICGIAILVVLLIFLRIEQHKRKVTDQFNKNGGQLLKSIKIEIFSKKELKNITKDYSSLLGKGAFGEVFGGNISDSDSTRVAVKRFVLAGKAINEDVHRESFANEIKIQSQINHRNVVQLRGCCLETEVPMLVYEFVPRGSLHDVLHNKKDPLPLETRLDIAIDSAVALVYMHSEANQKILHGDVKSGNILLDDKFMPKVSDFGTSRFLSFDKDHTNMVIGDMSYIDPVYTKTGLLTEKSDVYSFGIVLLELVTRKKARYDENNSLPMNYEKASRDGTTRQIIDKEVADMGEECVDCLEEIGKIAMHCLNNEVDDRPTMSDVADRLKLCKSRWIECNGKTRQSCM
ncbi:unnamed protein product [Alopecurus aequalis]